MKKTPIEMINLTFSAIMVLITIIGAFVFLFTDLMNDRLFGIRRYILGAIFIIYSIYRTYRIYKAVKS